MYLGINRIMTNENYLGMPLFFGRSKKLILRDIQETYYPQQAKQCQFNRLHKKMNRRQIPVSPSCVFCGQENEDLDHLIFLTCELARVVWFGSNLSIRIEALLLANLHDQLFQQLSNNQLCQDEVFWFYGQFVTVLWFIWKHRNEVLFRNAIPNPTAVLSQQKGYWSVCVQMLQVLFCRFVGIKDRAALEQHLHSNKLMVHFYGQFDVLRSRGKYMLNF